MSWHDRQAPGSLHAIVVYDCDRVDRHGQQRDQLRPARRDRAGGARGGGGRAQPRPVRHDGDLRPGDGLAARGASRTSTSSACGPGTTTAEAYSTHTQTLLGALATIRAAGAQQRDRERFDAETEGFVAAGYAAAVAGSRHQAIQGAMAAVAGVAVLIVGGVLVSRDDLSLGGLFAFYAVVALMLRQLSTALSAVPGRARGRRRVRPGATRSRRVTSRRRTAAASGSTSRARSRWRA